MHLEHDDNPDAENYIHYPSGIKFFTKDILLILLGIVAFTQFLNHNLNKANFTANSSSKKLSLFILQSLIFSLFFFSGFWWGYFVFWIFPLVTVAKTLAHFRNVAEHGLPRPIPNNKNLERLRTIKSNFFEKFFFAPLGFNYHAEHHMFPGLLHHQLALLSCRLIEQPYY